MPVIGGQRYITSTAVFMNEVIKLAVCLTASLYEISRTISPSLPATSLFSEVTTAVFTGDSWKLAIPASLFVLQNSLQYIAISNLDSATYQVTYQFKILPTAIFSVFILKRGLSLRKWVALALLTVGVVIIQIPASDPHLAPFKITHPQWHIPRSLENAQGFGGLTARAMHRRSATYEGIAEDEGLLQLHTNSAVGFAAAISGCTISALASICFERIIKETAAPASLWIRNVQLAFYSLFPSLFIGVMFVDGEQIAQNGFFVGYTWFVWLTITCQTIGGILVSFCIMYADNIAKSFAMSLSILLGLCASVLFFDFEFLVGTSIVLFATYLYNSSSDQTPRPPPIRIHDYEKTTIDGSQGREHTLRKHPIRPLKSPGFSSSRPTSPSSHHFRAGSSREYIGDKPLNG
ncbi:MAG: hypothetical protein Q9163_000833 [Psora crenata]